MQEGEIYTRPLRSARSTDAYSLAGHEREEWEPRFTFHGFRYAEVSGWPGDLEAAVAAGDVVARVLHTDMERTGWFGCSDPLVERLHENVVWSMRGNFLDIPTDCPQRDERVGWTGDLQVFAPTATFLYDVSGMLSGWLKDVALEQLPDGTVPWYVPVIPAHHMWTPIRPGAVWGDVAVLTPWTLFDRFGDLEVLRRQYDSARRWVDLVERLAGPDRLWDSGFQLGDWLDPAAPPHDPADARTDRYLVATAYFAWSADRLAATAHALGRADDARRYAALAAEVRAAFVGRYVGADGVLTSDAQTAYALAIAFDLLPPERAGPGGPPAGRARRGVRPPDRDRVRRYPRGLRRPQPHRPHRRRLRPPAGDAGPLVALRRHPGRDDDLGTVGQPPARRHGELGVDDLLQPLRPRRRRRLAAPGGGRARSRGSGIPGAPRPAPSRAAG